MQYVNRPDERDVPGRDALASTQDATRCGAVNAAPQPRLGPESGAVVPAGSRPVGGLTRSGCLGRLIRR